MKDVQHIDQYYDELLPLVVSTLQKLLDFFPLFFNFLPLAYPLTSTLFTIISYANIPNATSEIFLKIPQSKGANKQFKCK